MWVIKKKITQINGEENGTNSRIITIRKWIRRNRSLIIDMGCS